MYKPFIHWYSPFVQHIYIYNNIITPPLIFIIFSFIFFVSRSYHLLKLSIRAFIIYVPFYFLPSCTQRIGIYVLSHLQINYILKLLYANLQFIKSIHYCKLAHNS